MSSQTTGLVLLAVAGTLLWSPWALVLAGVLLVVVPEVLALVRARRVLARERARFRAGMVDAPPVTPS